ncbi:MAG TPA: hypothetical protein VIL42_02685 [Sphingomicrobium sp.]
MPTYSITIINDEFETSTNAEAADDALAIRDALQGALQIGVEQVVGGASLFAAELTVAIEERRRRFVVNVSASALKW